MLLAGQAEDGNPQPALRQVWIRVNISLTLYIKRYLHRNSWQVNWDLFMTLIIMKMLTQTLNI